MGGRVVKYKISTYEIMFAVPEILLVMTLLLLEVL